MKHDSYSITTIESQKDRQDFYLSNGVKPPNKYCAFVKGCIGGDHCSGLFAIPENNESIHDAVIRVVQEEINDKSIFEDNAKSKALKEK